MATSSKTEKEDKTFLKRIDWLDLGIKVASHATIAVASGYFGQIGSDLYQSRKLKRLSKSVDSNILPIKESKTA